MWVEILGFIGKVFDNNYASNHKDNIFLADHLKLIEDRIGIDAKGGVEFDLYCRFKVCFFIEFSGLGIFVLNNFSDLEVFLCFHNNRIWILNKI